MRLLADQDVYAATVLYLRGLGHDVTTAAEIGMSRSEDADLLRSARAEGRVFVTRDRDYGGLVFVQSLGSGVLYLRVLPSTLVAVHASWGVCSRSMKSRTFSARLWSWSRAVIECGKRRRTREEIPNLVPRRSPRYPSPAGGASPPSFAVRRLRMAHVAWFAPHDRDWRVCR